MKNSKNPLISEKANQIIEKMTAPERRKYQKYIFPYIIWLVLLMALPAGIAVGGLSAGTFTMNHLLTMFFLLLLFCVSYPFWWQWQRNLFCNTEWAQRQDIQPDSLKLFRWSE
jgi:hypothetical protein